MNLGRPRRRHLVAVRCRPRSSPSAATTPSTPKSSATRRPPNRSSSSSRPPPSSPPNGTIVRPPQSQRVDFEGELAIVIGTIAQNIQRADWRDSFSASPAPTTSPPATCRRRTCSSPAARASTRSARSAPASRPISILRALAPRRG